MEFSLRALEQLIAVVEENSFTRAAERMHVAQPWLSARIRRLEEAVGLTLLDRTSRTIRPTVDGESFLKQARVVVREARHLVTLSHELTHGLSGLRIGAAPYTYFVPERQTLFDAFSGAHPEISLEIENGQDPQLREGVLRGDLDAAIVTGSPPNDTEGLLLRTNPLMLMIPREHPLAKYDRIPIEVLAGVSIAAFRRSANPVAWDETIGRIAAAGSVICSLPEPMRRAQINLARRDRLILAVFGSITGYDETSDDTDEDALVTREIADPTLRADIFLIRRCLPEPRRALFRFWSYATAALAL